MRGNWEASRWNLTAACLVAVLVTGCSRKGSHIGPTTQPMTRPTAVSEADLAAIPIPADVVRVLSPSGPLPTIYSQRPPDHWLMAERAAQLDACRNLLRACLELAATEFPAPRPATWRETLGGMLRGTRLTDVAYAPDGAVQVEMLLESQAVRKMLVAIRPGDDAAAARARPIRVVGHGLLPPPPATRPVTQPAASHQGPTVLRAVGTSAMEEGHVPDPG